MEETTEVLPREVIQYDIVANGTFAVLRREFNACICRNDLRGARALVRHALCLATRVCRWFPSPALTEFRAAYERSVRMEAFDLAFDACMRDQQLLLSRLQADYLMHMRSAVFHLPLGSPDTLLVRYPPENDHIYVQTLVAFALAISTPHSDVMCISLTDRDGINWLTRVKHFINASKTIIESSSPQFVRVRCRGSDRANTISAVSFGYGAPSNIRGCGIPAVCFLNQTEVVHIGLFPAIFPAMDVGRARVMTSAKSPSDASSRALREYFSGTNGRPSIHEVDLMERSVVPQGDDRQDFLARLRALPIIGASF